MSTILFKRNECKHYSLGYTTNATWISILVWVAIKSIHSYPLGSMLLLSINDRSSHVLINDILFSHSHGAISFSFFLALFIFHFVDLDLYMTIQIAFNVNLKLVGFNQALVSTNLALLTSLLK